MNAALRAIVRTALNFGHTIYGVKRGYEGLINNDMEPLTATSVSNIIKYGGTIIQTARSPGFLTPEGRQQAYETIKKRNINSLIVIGGDGSFHGLHELILEHGIQGIGVPGTIDNDLYGTDYTIGFDTAVNTALDAIDKIRDTATSHSRLFIIEVMGHTSGYIALYTGIGGGAEEIIVPESPVDLSKIWARLNMGRARGKKSSIVVVAEGERTGGAAAVKAHIEKYSDWEVKVSILGHIQRGGAPTAFDRFLASRLGYEAVFAIMRNETDKMVGIVDKAVTLTPLTETWTKKKELDLSYLAMNDVLSSLSYPFSTPGITAGR